MRYRPKHTKQNKPHFSAWIMRIAAVVGCLTIISAYLLSGVYAKFSTTANGSDSARVAKFEVVMNAAENQDMAFDGSTHNGDAQERIYNFSVISNSEVTVDYSITVKFTDPIPANMSVQIDGQEVQNGDGVKTAFQFEGGTFDLTEKSKSHQLKITVKYMDGENVIENDFNTSVKVIVNAEQKD